MLAQKDHELRQLRAQRSNPESGRQPPSKQDLVTLRRPPSKKHKSFNDIAQNYRLIRPKTLEH
jgi:hypothetical protein